MTKPRMFSERESGQLAEMVRDKATLRRMTTFFNCSKSTLYRQLWHIGLRRSGRVNRPITEAEGKAILEAARKGVPSRAIADELGRNRGSVICYAKRHGARFNSLVQRADVHGEPKRLESNRDVYKPTTEKMAAFVEAGKAELARVRA